MKETIYTEVILIHQKQEKTKKHTSYSDIQKIRFLEET